jgi:hypothetical protein
MLRYLFLACGLLSTLMLLQLSIPSASAQAPQPCEEIVTDPSSCTPG